MDKSSRLQPFMCEIYCDIRIYIYLYGHILGHIYGRKCKENMMVHDHFAHKIPVPWFTFNLLPDCLCLQAACRASRIRNHVFGSSIP